MLIRWEICKFMQIPLREGATLLRRTQFSGATSRTRMNIKVKSSSLAAAMTLSWGRENTF